MIRLSVRTVAGISSDNSFIKKKWIFLRQRPENNRVNLGILNNVLRDVHVFYA